MNVRRTTARRPWLFLLAMGLFIGGNTQAQIQVVDGGTSAVTTVGAGSVIQNTNFTISPLANTLVIELWDRNQQGNQSSPNYVTWSNAALGTVQTAIRCVSEVSGASAYSDCDIYYLFNPAPGAGVLTATDTNGAALLQGMVMLPVTLSGVDTTILPATYANNAATATTLSVNTSSATLAGSFAAVLSYFGTQNAAMTNASTSGTSVNQLENIEHEECLGYVTGLAAGSSTITMSETNDGGTKCTLAVAVFSPNQGINIQDGSTAFAHTGGSTSVTISNFTVTPGASVLVVSLFDRNGNAGNLSPSSLSWGSQTLTRVISENNAAATYGDSDIYYLWNPTPGTQTITATDTSGATPSAMTMQAFDLNGVNTSDAPVTYGTNFNGTISVTLTTASGTPFGSCIVINSSYGTGNASMVVTASDGSLNCPEINNTTSQCMGLDNDAYGATTITATDNAGTQKMALALAVFTPNVIETPPAPVAPINPVAVGQIRQVTLTWLDGSGGEATGYVISRSATSGSGFAPIATNSGNGATAYVDTAVTPNIPYYYEIAGMNVEGVTGASSAQVSAIPAVPLGAPTNVTATAQTNRVLVQWTDSTGGQASGYVILRATNSGGPYSVVTTNSGNGNTTFIDSTVLDGTTYYYEIESLSGVYGGNPSTPPASATPFYALPEGEAGTLTLLDGGESSLTAIDGSSTIAANFNVSPEASVMVVELWDQNGQANHSSPATLTWNNQNTGTSQTLVRAISQSDAATPFADCDIYYLFNPAQGSGTISGVDTNASSPTGIRLIAFDLTGVNTAVPPVVYGVNNSSASSLSVSLSSNTPAGSWAAVIGSDANSASTLNITSSSGTVTQGDVNDSQEQDMGYIGGLHGGSGTISMTATGGASDTAMAAAVFAPAIGTGIFLQDGSINSIIFATSTNATLPFEVTEGASMMVCEVIDENNNTTDPGPTIIWSNTTLGTIQVLTPSIQTNTTQFTYIWNDLYYLMDPLPGKGVVIAYDPNVPGGDTLGIEVYDLGGVDTTVAPYGFGIGESQASTLSVSTPSTTVYGSWAAVISDNYNGGTGNNIVIQANTGGEVENNFRPIGLQCTFGYLTNLGAGAGTITANATGSSTHMDLAAMVISALPGTAAPINVAASGELNQILLTWQDGSGGLASGYYVLRSTNSLSGFVTVSTNTGNGATSFTDTNVIDWTTYYYEVQANGPGGLSLFSAEVSTNAIGVAATPTGLTAEGEINSDLLAWSPQLGASVFDIYRSTTGTNGFTLVGTSATTNFTDMNVSDGTLYYYEIAASNNIGISARTGTASAIPAVAFFTNWIGVFNTPDSVANWNQFDGATNTQTSAAFSGDAPFPSFSVGSMQYSSIYGPYTTNDLQGIATNFPAINVSTYRNIEFDVVNDGPWDQSGQIQGVEVNLQVPVTGTPTYEQGNSPTITLLQNGTGGQWTHYVIPVSDWTGFDLTGLTGFGLNVYDESFEFATTVGVEFDNIEFSQAPAWAASISVSNQSASSGSTSVLLSGTVSGTVAGAPVYLAQGTPISVTINGITQSNSISDATGDFTINFNTTGFANGVYPITYVTPADFVSLVGATNSSTTLAIHSAPTSPTIQPPTVSNGQLQVKVASLSGYNYYLLSTTNLTPPAVWMTNSTMAGTGGVLTFSVPISGNPADLFLKLKVQ